MAEYTAGLCRSDQEAHGCASGVPSQGVSHSRLRWRASTQAAASRTRIGRTPTPSWTNDTGQPRLTRGSPVVPATPQLSHRVADNGPEDRSAIADGAG